MDVMSVVIIGLIVIFGVVGFVRGFFNIFIGILKSLSSFLISFFLAKPFGNLLYRFGLGNIIARDIEKTLVKDSEFFNIIMTNDNKEEVINEALTKLNIPEFLHSIVRGMGNNILTDLDGHSVGYYISIAAANLCCIAIGFVILLLFSGAIILLLRKIFNKLAKVTIIGITNKIAGAIVNVVFILFMVSFALWGIATLTTFMPSLNDTIARLFSLNSDKMTLARWMYENNLIIKLFELFVK